MWEKKMNKSEEIYESKINLNSESDETNDELFNLSYSNILKESNYPNTHYLCPQCKFFYSIESINDKGKSISLYCPCRKKIEKINISDLLNPEKKYMTILNNNNPNEINTHNNNLNDNIFKCCHKNLDRCHNYNYKYFCNNCHKNLCRKCYKNHRKNSHKLEIFDFLKDEKSEKVNKIIEFINAQKAKFNDHSSESEIKEKSFKIDIENSDVNIINKNEKYDSFFIELII
jgi:hypothetical protein